MENNANQLNPMLCKRNCGFFGNAAYDGYCSKCYKDHVKRQNTGSAAGRVTPTTGLTSSTTSVSNQSQSIEQIPVNSLSIMSQQATAMIIESSNNMNANQVQAQEAISTNADAAVNDVNITDSNDVNNSPMSSQVQQQKQPEIQQQQQQQKLEQEAMETNSEKSNTNSTTTHNSAISMPIPIPSRIAANNQQIDPTAMSVPNDVLLSSSLLSTSTSPLGATPIGDNSLSGVSMGGSDKKKRNRCCVESCKRKVGLTGFDCRCGGLYCWEHRYSDKHDCKFDYKELGQDQIRKNNPIVIGEKIQKI